MDHKPGHRQTPITDLELHPDNPRDGDIGAIAESIKANGFFGSVVAQCSTRHVLAGNHRVQAAQHLGMKKVPVHWVDVDNNTAKRILLADNRTSDLATNDDEALAKLLTSLANDHVDNLVGSGFDGDDLDILLADIERNNSDLDLSDLGDVLDDGLTPAEREASWRESGIRSFILPYSSGEFEKVVDAFAARRSELGVDTNADVVALLLGVR